MAVMDAIRSYMGYDEAGPEQQKAIEFDIAHSTPRELMDRFLNWEGIIGYTDTIISAWEELNDKASKKEI